jgi:hypothetical protein
LKKPLKNRDIFNVVRPLAHLALLALSTLLTINLFYQFSSNSFFQIVWIVFAVTLELVKIYLYMLSKRDFAKKYLTAILSGIGKFIVFTGLATISFFASAGFTFASIQEQSDTAIVLNEVTDTTVNELQIKWDRYYSYQKDIDEAQDQIDGLGDNWITRREELRERIEEYRNKQDSVMDEINFLNDQRKEEVSEKKFIALSIFDLLGAEIDWKGKLVMKRMMLLLALLLEICTVLTSGSVSNISILSQRMEEFLNHYLYQDDNGVWKKKDINVTAQSLGWSMEECREYESFIKDCTFGGKQVVDRNGNVNYDKDSIDKIMYWKTNSN